VRVRSLVIEETKTHETFKLKVQTVLVCVRICDP